MGGREGEVVDRSFEIFEILKCMILASENISKISVRKSMEGYRKFY